MKSKMDLVLDSELYWLNAVISVQSLFLALSQSAP